MKHAPALVLCAFVTLPAASQTVFPIEVQKRGTNAGAGVATLVAEEQALTSARLIGTGDRYVITTAIGAQLVATLAARDEDADLALLTVKGLAGTPATIAATAAERDRRVHLLLPTGLREGVMHSPVERDGNRLYRFSGAATEGEDGAPLMNNCNELLAISQLPGRRWRREDRHFGISGDLSSLIAFLDSGSVPFVVAAEPCQSVEDQLAAAKRQQEDLEAEKKALEEQAAEAEEQNQERLDEIEAEREQLAEELAAKQSQLAEKERLQRELEEKQAEDAHQAEEERRKAEAAEQARRVAEEEHAQERRLIVIGGSVLALVLAALGAFALARARARKRSVAKSNQLLAEARGALARASASFPDVVLVGRGPNDEDVRVKINGSALARSDDGQFIGRSSANADYVLNDQSVSRRHARLRVVGNSLTVEDLDSLNGTRLDGTDLSEGQPQSIADGATLAFGDVTLVAHFMKD